MTANIKTPAGLGARRDRTVQEYQHDTYKLRGKLKEPTVCPECGALFHKGRWTWETAPSKAEKAICPACHRVRDKYPKGLVTIKGGFKDEQLDRTKTRRPGDFDDRHPSSQTHRRSAETCLSWQA